MATNNVKKDFEKAYKAGKLTVNKGEVITPSSVVRGVAKVAAKVTGPNLTAAEKAIVASVKKIVKTGKPGDVQKALDKLSLAEKRAYSQALKKAVSATNKIGKPAKQATPLKSVKRTTDPILPKEKPQKLEGNTVLEQQYNKAVRASKAAGLDPTKVKVTIDGKSMGYKA